MTRSATSQESQESQVAEVGNPSLPRRTYELPLLVSTTEWNKPGSTKKGQAIKKHPRSKTQRSPAKQFIAYIYIPYV